MRVCSPSVRSNILDRTVILLYGAVVYLFGLCPQLKNISGAVDLFLKLGNIQIGLFIRPAVGFLSWCISVFAFHEIVSACVLVCICLWGLMSFTPLARRRPRGNSSLAV